MFRTVKYVRFQTGMFHPGVGSIGDVLPSQNRTFRDLTMKESTNGLEVTLNGRTIIMPYANIAGYEVAPEAPASVSPVKKSA